MTNHKEHEYTAMNNEETMHYHCISDHKYHDDEVVPNTYFM